MTGEENSQKQQQQKCTICKEPFTATTTTSATKQLSLCRAPPYLLVYLKRFEGCDEAKQAAAKKNNRPVKIDLTLTVGNSSSYRLIGVVLHEGTSLADGHYGTLVKATGNGNGSTAKPRGQLNSCWMAIEDEQVFANECTGPMATLVMQKFAFIALFASVDKQQS